jgi:hypothetical protein
MDEIASSGGSDGVLDVYIVQPGDTLWDISQQSLGQSEHWPQLWSINDYITNPHWIYPGSQIVFTPGSLLEPPGISLGGPGDGSATSRDGYQTQSYSFQEDDLVCGPDIRFDGTYPVRVYRAPAFLAHADELSKVGEIAFARTGHELLANPNRLTLRLEEADSVECGDVLSVVRMKKKRVKHPKSRIKYGSLYEVVGEVKILTVDGDLAEAGVRHNFTEAQRGDWIVAHVPVDVEVEVVPPEGELDGTIVLRLGGDEFKLGTTQNTVMLDRGSVDGVRIGSSFFIVEQRDEFLDPVGVTEGMGPSIIGRVVVVRVDESVSTAVIVDASRSVPEGARFTTSLEY